MQPRRADKVDFKYENKNITVYFDLDVFDFIDPEMGDNQKQIQYELICRSLVTDPKDFLNITHIYRGHSAEFFIDRVINVAKPPATHTLSIAYGTEVRPIELQLNPRLGSQIKIGKSVNDFLPNHLLSILPLIEGYRKDFQKKSQRAFIGGQINGNVPLLLPPVAKFYTNDNYSYEKAKNFFNVPSYDNVVETLSSSQDLLNKLIFSVESYSPGSLLELPASFYKEFDVHRFQQMLSQLLLEQDYHEQYQKTIEDTKIFTGKLQQEIEEKLIALESFYIEYKNDEAALNYPKELIIFALKKAALEYYTILDAEIRSESKVKEFNKKFSGIAIVREGGVMVFDKSIDTINFVTLQGIVTNSLTECTRAKTIKSRSLNALKRNLQVINADWQKVKKQPLFKMTNTSFDFNPDLKLTEQEISLQNQFNDKRKKLEGTGSHFFSFGLKQKIQKFEQGLLAKLIRQNTKLKKQIELIKRFLVLQQQGEKFITNAGFITAKMDADISNYKQSEEKTQSIDEIYQVMKTIYLLAENELNKLKLLVEEMKSHQFSDLSDEAEFLRCHYKTMTSLSDIFSCLQRILEHLEKIKLTKIEILSFYERTNELPKKIELVLSDANQLLQNIELEQIKQFLISTELSQCLNKPIQEALKTVSNFLNTFNETLATIEKSIHFATLKINSVKKIEQSLSLYRDLKLNADTYKNTSIVEKLNTVNQLLDELCELTNRDNVHSINSLCDNINKELTFAKDQTNNFHQSERKKEVFRSPYIQKVMVLYRLIIKMIQTDCTCWEKNPGLQFFTSNKLSEKEFPPIRVKDRIDRMRVAIKSYQDFDDIDIAKKLLNRISEIAHDKKSLNKTNPDTQRFYDFILTNSPDLIRGLSLEKSDQEKVNLDMMYENAKIIIMCSMKMNVETFEESRLFYSSEKKQLQLST